MQDSNQPPKVPLKWAASAGAGYITTIPTLSQIGIANGRASWTDGFPPLNFTPTAAGGVPPFGEDFNGVLQEISAGLQWLQAGGPVSFDTAFSTAIGGYPQGAVIASATTLGLLWQSTVDNNTSNPDTGGANWLAIVLPIIPQAGLTVYVRSDGSDSNNGLANTAGGAFQTLQGALTGIVKQYALPPYRQLTIVIGLAGTYAGDITPPIGSNILLKGNTGVPASYVMSGGSAGHDVLSVSNSACTLQDLTVQNTGSGQNWVGAAGGGSLTLQNVAFTMTAGSNSFTPIVAFPGGSIYVKNVTFASLTCASFWFAHGGGAITISPDNASTATFNGTNTVSWSAQVTDLGYMILGNPWVVNVVGSVTGEKFNVSTNGVINTEGLGSTIFPGTGSTTGPGGVIV